MGRLRALPRSRSTSDGRRIRNFPSQTTLLGNNCLNRPPTAGADIYVDVGGWHLFLRDMKVHTGVAFALQSKMASGKVDEPDVIDVLKKIPVKVRLAAAIGAR